MADQILPPCRKDTLHQGDAEVVVRLGQVGLAAGSLLEMGDGIGVLALPADGLAQGVIGGGELGQDA
jgi:hypothetical protein